jgi:hypothetical protein
LDSTGSGQGPVVSAVMNLGFLRHGVSIIVSLGVGISCSTFEVSGGGGGTSGNDTFGEQHFMRIAFNTSRAQYHHLSL